MTTYTPIDYFKVFLNAHVLDDDTKDELCSEFIQVKDSWENNKLGHLNYRYVLYKLLQLRGYNVKYAVYKREKVDMWDIKWRSVCTDLGWKYMSSETA